jgi:chemotaxis protein MotC
MIRALLMAGWLLAAMVPGLANTPNPYVVIRALQELQTQIVQGRARAREDQPKLLADIGKQFVATPQEFWVDPRNARAAVIWLLSGGSPRTMRGILRYQTFAKSELNLARGVLAFSEGRVAEARELLKSIEPRHLDPVLGGQLALVLAALVLSEDMTKSIEYLGVARLLAPGSLIEETALRRQISLVGQTSDAAAFATLSRQYTRRFKTSLYAQDFREAFAQSFMRIGTRASDEQLVSLEPILETFEIDERCRLSILIARASLLEGAWRSAAVFAEVVMRPPVDPNCDVPRARLYRAAARLASVGDDVDLLALQKLDPARLSAEDRALLKATLTSSQLARSWPEPRRWDDADDIGHRGEEAMGLASRALDVSASLLKESRR